MHTDEFMATVKLTDEGGYLFELPDTRSFTVPASVFLALNMWDESRDDFSWDQDADDATSLCLMALHRRGVHVVSPAHLKRLIRLISIPGPPYEPGQMFWVRFTR